MTPAQRAAAERLADYISADAWPGGLNAAKLDEAAALLRELAAEPAQEPVACQYAQDVGMPEYRCVGKCQYAAPPQRQPLSDEQIDELVLQEQFLLICDGLEELTEIVRAVEQAHGITGETK